MKGRMNLYTREMFFSQYSLLRNRYNTALYINRPYGTGFYDTVYSHAIFKFDILKDLVDVGKEIIYF
jgi:hypothetical protein